MAGPGGAKGKGDKRSKRSKISRQAAATTPGTADQSSQAAATTPGPAAQSSGCPTTASLLPAIPTMAIGDLSSVVDMAKAPDCVHLQHDVIEACLARILGRPPRLEQVRTLRRLIFTSGDTLLIARTGWGKSIIFHAFSVLTKMITLQIIPLSKLGDEQLDDIRRIGDTRPVLLTKATKAKERDLFQRIRHSEFTHILLGPEQASSTAFRTLLKEPEVQSKIGLVAIDECHTIRQWSNFRPQFTLLGQLRLVLRQDIVWFACSATLDAETEENVLSHAGFRQIGPNPFQTEVIRTSVNRDDISFSVHALPRNKTTSFEALYFLVSCAVDNDGVPTPEKIPKAIVFVDSRVGVGEAARYLRRLLIHSTSKANNSAARYLENWSGIDSRGVNTVVEEFTSTVAQHDKDVRYAEFKSTSSRIRIMVATTSLGMGVNVPDVERVVVWRFPVGMDLGDVWQRLGRGGRGPGRRSEGFIFLPYWAFDSQGKERPAREVAAGEGPSSLSSPKRGRQPRHQLPSTRRAKQSSRLQISFSQDDVASDAESVASSICSDASQVSQGQQNSQAVPYWKEDEQRRRAELPAEWRDMLNAGCHRRIFLMFLGEDKLPPGAERVVVADGPCCSACSPASFEPLPDAPRIETPVVAPPRAGTKAHAALGLINRWALEMVETEYPDPAMELPPDIIIEKKLRLQLAYLFAKPRGSVMNWEAVTPASLVVEIPALESWRLWAREQCRLVDRLRSTSRKPFRELAELGELAELEPFELAKLAELTELAELAEHDG